MKEGRVTKEKLVLKDVIESLNKIEFSYIETNKKISIKLLIGLLIILLCFMCFFGVTLSNVIKDQNNSEKLNFDLHEAYCVCGHCMLYEREYCDRCGEHTSKAEVYPHKECKSCNEKYHHGLSFCELCGNELTWLNNGEKISLQELGFNSFMDVSTFTFINNINLLALYFIMAIDFALIVYVIQKLLYCVRLSAMNNLAIELNNIIDKSLIRYKHYEEE